MKHLLRRSPALRIALIYLVFGLAWILASDVLLSLATGELGILLGMSLTKGLLFVAVTAILLYWLLNTSIGRALEAEPSAVEVPIKPVKPLRMILGALALLTLVPILSLGVVLIHGPQLEREAYSSLDAVAALKAEQLGQWLAERHGDALLLASDERFSQQLEQLLADSSPDPTLAAVVSSRLAALVDVYDYEGVLVVVPEGEVVLRIGAHSELMLPLDSLILRAQVENRVLQSALQRDQDGGVHLDWVVPFSVEEGGGRRAVATILLRAGTEAFLYPTLRAWPTASPSAETLLVERKGDFAVFLSVARHHQWEPLVQKVPLGDPLPATAALLHDSDVGHVPGRDYRGVEVLAVFRRIAGTNWRLIAKVDRAEVMAPLRVLVYWVSLVAAAALLALATSAYFLWRLQQRNHRLEMAAQAAEKDRLLMKFYELPFVGMAITSPQTKRWSRFNDRLCEIFGYSRDELVEMTWVELTYPPDLDADLAEFERVIAGKSDGYAMEKRFVRKDGRIVDTEIDVRVVRHADGSIDYFIATIDDISERKRQEERLRLAAALFDNTREGVVVTDRDTCILQVNKAFVELTGYREDEAVGRTPALLRSDRHDAAFFDAMWRRIDATGHWQGELWNQRKNGTLYPVLLNISAVRDDAGRVVQYVGAFSDLSRIKDSESRLDFLVHHDPLTELPNRLLLVSRLDHAIDVAAREGQLVALLLLDLDRFKDVNDSFGHPAGDDLLRQTARRLGGCLAAADTLARLGGDEFGILLEDIVDPQDAARVAERLITALGETTRLPDGSEVRIGASIGISVYQGQNEDAGEMLRQADAALYRAKAGGRSRFDFYTEDLTRSARLRVETERRLRCALADGQLVAHYQPQVEIATGRVVGVEALVRWRDPQRGLIPPGEFIPLAEETGLIGALGDWVLHEACRQGVLWMEVGIAPLVVAVNLSAHQLRQGDIVESVARVLRQTGFPAERLELELTESALMEREGDTVGVLDRLREQGIMMAVDDFGTGYSSFAYLRRFHLDVLKIDKRFIDEIDQQPDARTIVDAIIAMGHALGLKVLAEGVETQAQLDILRTQGCDLFQGYLRSRPLEPDAVTSLLRTDGRGRSLVLRVATEDRRVQ
ncbi:bifunctional diguanylate cyclase/phosphodiesterase [Thiocapsa roseopersicina]|uniref:cyclic-guanylate-specific phosphodiesterase n=1 Tax=Thiocapsa roseopersicina TaxID=1058 RepID=A0A1H2ZJ08_THIRO|nr:EAL domain-containing protein [Thiocapsa roseopersicina]SDX17355.1 PAS domain S-box-containing protein/diguanylate cyclase (GGDEF) domain-containing protein [Thiocapsa roseopersicina]